MRIRLAVLPALALAALAMTACASGTTESSTSPSSSMTADASASGDCAGVTVIVDAGDLEAADDPSLETCVETDEPIVAADALAEAGVETEGTADYGDQVVCRVDGAPAESDTIVSTDGTEYHETCQSMPAAFAYWSIWVQPADGEWAYAEEGLATQELQPGDRLELLFTLNGEPAAPLD